MKKRIYLVVLFVVCTMLLAACQCNHDWIEADCTTAKTCSKCKETIGTPLGHAWLSATCTEPKSCSACGRKEGAAEGHQWNYATCENPKTCSVCQITEGRAEGHQWVSATCTAPQYCTICYESVGTALGHSWIPGVTRSGIEGGVCVNCGEVEMMTYEWTPLTNCEKGPFSNETAHLADIKVGNWDTRAGELPDSIRFCVANQEKYKNTHYCNYKLNGNYSYISGLISFCDNSDDYATAKIQIYLDNKLEFESNVLSDLSDDQSFTLDASGVNIVRIVCSTTDPHRAYCVVSASVY